METAQRAWSVVCATNGGTCRIEHGSAIGASLSACSWQAVAPAEVGFGSMHAPEARLIF